MEDNSATLAWQLLAALEGSSLMLAATALVVHAVRNRGYTTVQNTIDLKPTGKPLRVFITNLHGSLGQEISNRLKAHGCVVITDLESNRLDVLVVIGSEMKNSGLDGLSELVSEDLFGSLKSLEALMCRVEPHGRVLWVSSAGACNGPFADAADAFNNLLRVQFQQIAHASQCDAVWLGRQGSVAQAAAKVVDALLLEQTVSESGHPAFSIRNLAVKAKSQLWRWFKITT